METKKTTFACGYTRSAATDTSERQQRAIEEHCLTSGYDEPILFHDKGVSGVTNQDRAGFHDLMEKIKELPDAIVIVEEPSRLARNENVYHHMLSLITAAGATLETAGSRPVATLNEMPLTEIGQDATDSEKE